MKTREALEWLLKAMYRITRSAWFIDAKFHEVHTVQCACAFAEAALASTPRNCDVGTAEEQVRRFAEFCDGYCRFKPDGVDCGDCPLLSPCHYPLLCALKWEQMPYEPKGGAE